MKIPKITLERARSLIEYNPITGYVTWRIQQGKSRIGDEVGSIQAGYKKTTIDNEQVKLHRLVWFVTHGKWPDGQIDHMDGNKTNNAIANLRDVSMSINMQNRYAMKRKESSLPMGVTKNGHGKFLANIRIGIFDTAEEAGTAYMNVKRLIHEGCTR